MKTYRIYSIEINIINAEIGRNQPLILSVHREK